MCVSFIESFSLKRSLVWFFLRLCAENVFSTQVELAHGGRGQSYSYDRSSSYSSTRRGGVSRRSDYCGWYFCLLRKFTYSSLQRFSWLHFMNHTVMVTGLPSSASWQDLKVLPL